MMRVKNEARWIERCVRSLFPACEHVYIFDDHSTDDTVTICEAIPNVTVFRSPFNHQREDLDKNWLLERVENSGATHVVHIDGDEEIAPGGCDEIVRLAKENRHDSYRFRVLYLWDSDKQIRWDGIYGRFRRSSMFRLRPGYRFKSACAGGFHCGNVPQGHSPGECNVKLLHFGYMHREDRIRKWDWYCSIDPKNYAEGYRDEFPERRSYPHMVQGDVPEVPARATLIHAGPLTLVPIASVV